MQKQEVIISNNLTQALQHAMSLCQFDKLFVLTDHTTVQLCLPLARQTGCLEGAQVITIGATDSHKNIESLGQVWSALGTGGGTRHSLLVNL